LLKLRGGKKVPVKREDLSDEGYDWWLQKAEFERELYLRGDLAADAKIDDNDVKEFQDNIKAEERRKREEYLEGKVKADPDFSYTVPSDLDFEKHPENRNVFLQDEIPQDEDHWTRDMFEALEYGLRKHGTAWTRILRSKKGRKVFRFMDQSDLLAKWRKEKDKNPNWGVWPNFYYYKGAPGRKHRSERTHIDPIAHIPGVYRKNHKLLAKKKEETLPESGYPDVYWSRFKEGWVGMYKYWHGGARITGRVTKGFTPAYDTPKEAYESLQQMKEEMGLKAGEEFEEAMERLGLDTIRIVGRDRLRVYEWMEKAGFVNRSVDRTLLETPMPIRLKKATLFKHKLTRW